MKPRLRAAGFAQPAARNPQDERLLACLSAIHKRHFSGLWAKRCVAKI